MRTMRRSFARSSASAGQGPRGRARGRSVPALLAIALAVACRPSRDELDSRTFLCDSASVSDQCGTDRYGAPMTCFAGGHLGSADFCTESCGGDGGGAAASVENACVGPGARLRRCHPSRQPASTTGDAECGNQLACYRTDLASDDGLCIAGGLCDLDSDCRTAIRSVCASTLLRAIYPAAPALALDHLTCVQTGCYRNNTACPPGEVCLPSRVPPQSEPADVCVPQCDSHLDCPPNYVCFQRASPLAPALCVPGLLGFKCQTDHDCMVGSCVATNAGFKVCSVPCQQDGDCTPFDGPRDTYLCVSPMPGAELHCMTAASFGGAPCIRDSDCLDGTHCAIFSPYGTASAGLGGCLPICGPAGECTARGGIPHTCFDFLDPPLCYPGKIGLYCRGDADCLGGLRCQPAHEITPDDASMEQPICTLPCASDEDCVANRFGFADEAWCDGGACVLPRQGDRLCERPLECQSKRCEPSTRMDEPRPGARRCVALPVGTL
jgi:hypothetical protein